MIKIPQIILKDWSKLHPHVVLMGIIAHYFDVRITSVFRNDADNTRVGGVKNSYHLVGKAIDLVVNSNEMKGRMMGFGVDWLGMQCIDEGDHLHFEFDDGIH